jgi:hypothetical protein
MVTRRNAGLHHETGCPSTLGYQRRSRTPITSRELEAVAARSGWHVERVYEDAGIVAPRAGISALGSTPCSRR